MSDFQHLCPVLCEQIKKYNKKSMVQHTITIVSIIIENGERIYKRFCPISFPAFHKKLQVIFLVLFSHTRKTHISFFF